MPRPSEIKLDRDREISERENGAIDPAHRHYKSTNVPGTICAKCQRPIYPHTGRWMHRYGDRRDDFLGLHVPQHILPLHYLDKAKWGELLAKRNGAPALRELRLQGATPADVRARLNLLLP